MIVIFYKIYGKKNKVSKEKQNLYPKQHIL